MKIITCLLKIQWKADLYPEHHDCACYAVRVHGLSKLLQH